MNAFKKTSFLLLLAAACLGLTGCMAVSIASMVPSLGAAVETNSVDAALVAVHLATPVAGDTFVEDVKAVAKSKEYQVTTMYGGRGTNERNVILMKQSSGAGSLIGRYWQCTVTLSLQENGRDVQVNARMSGNNHQGDAGTAQVVADEFKTAITAQYAHKK